MSHTPLPSWPLPPAEVTLAADEVHVWRASLQVPDARVPRLYATLSTDEQERARHYRFRHDQQRFIVARGWLRTILSQYLHLEAGQVRFRYNPQGKPELDPAPIPKRGYGRVAPRPPVGNLCFNLAHSEDLALYAISRGRRIGVDLEHLRPGLADDRVTDSVFAPREVAALHSLPPRDQERAFFACWTRKEAYVKARGEGLVMPLDAFEVSLLPGDPPALLSMPGDPAEVTRWSLYELNLGPDYAATLAVEGQGWLLQLWQHPGLQ